MCSRYNQTNHSYPRSTDPVSGQFLPITYIDGNTFSVQVLRNIPSTNTTTHAFVSANSNSVTRGVVRTGGVYNHNFVSATSNMLKKQDGTIKVHVGNGGTGQYAHTFVNATEGAIISGGGYVHLDL